MRSSVVLAVALLLGAETPPITVPAEVKGEVGAFVTVQAETKGKVVEWVPLDGGLQMFPSDLLRTTTTAVVVASKPGRYRLLSYTAIDNVPTKPAICTVVIGNPPNPGPTPPGPNPPDPTDPFAKAVKVAFDADTGMTKVQSVKVLAAVYRKLAASITAVDFSNVGELFAVAKSAVGSAVSPDDLKGVRSVVSDRLNKSLGTDASAPVDSGFKTRASSEFIAIAEALESL
jgi:hypothetical protein